MPTELMNSTRRPQATPVALDRPLQVLYVEGRISAGNLCCCDCPAHQLMSAQVGSKMLLPHIIFAQLFGFRLTMGVKTITRLPKIIGELFFRISGNNYLHDYLPKIPGELFFGPFR